MPFSGIKLLICTPFYEIKAYTPYNVSMDMSNKLLNELGIEHTWMPVCGDSYVDRVKNTIVHRFLESDFTDLMMIDSDLEWSFDAIGRLLSVPYEVVGGDFPMKNNWESYISRLHCHPDGRPVMDPAGTGLIKAEWLPGGFLRLKKSCIEKMYEAYKEEGYQDPYADPTNPNRWYSAIINCEIREGKRYTEDINFCRKWQAIGGEIWLDPNITFTHYGVNGWTGNYHEFLLRQPGGAKAGCKKIYVENFNSCVPNLSNYFDYEADYTKADAILLWNDELKPQRDICARAKELNIPTFTMSHGVPYTTRKYALGNNDPPVSDYYLTWSEYDRELSIKHGLKPENAIVVGCPIIYDIKHKSDKRTVVYFPTHSPGNEQQSKETWKLINEIEGITSIAKLLNTEHNPEDYPGVQVITDRRLADHIAMSYSALKDAACMVIDDCGTHVLLAVNLDIPIIKVKNQYQNIYDFVTETDDLEGAIQEAIEHPEKYRQERLAFKKSFDYGDCGKNIARVINKVLQKNLEPKEAQIPGLKLNLACGQNKMPGYVNVDIATDCDLHVDLENFPWPWEDESVDEIYCSHYIEHTHDLNAFMDECYRIIKPSGKITLIAPYYNSIRAWQDPTHVRAISEATFAYYSKEWRDENKLDHYGIKSNFTSDIGLAFKPEWADKSEEERTFAMKHYVNVVDDIVTVLHKIK